MEGGDGIEYGQTEYRIQKAETDQRDAMGFAPPTPAELLDSGFSNSGFFFFSAPAPYGDNQRA
jgi:hypothetical protein